MKINRIEIDTNNADFFEGLDTPAGIDTAATLEAYQEQVIEKLTEIYPDTDISFQHAGVKAPLVHIYTDCEGVDASTEHQVKMDIAAASEAVILKGDFFHFIKPKRDLSLYQEKIIAATGCDVENVRIIEDVMREDILRSTLDALSPAEFDTAARAAVELFKELRALGMR